MSDESKDPLVESKDAVFQPPAVISFGTDAEKRNWREFPWWFLAMLIIAVGAAAFILSNEDYYEAFLFIRAGLQLTASTALISYVIAIVLGLLTGLGRISNSVFLTNFARLYIELIRGIPMMVLIFFIALVGVPFIINGFNTFSERFICT